MSRLLRKPNGTKGKVHDISPEDAGWSYVGFQLYRLSAGETVQEATDSTEVILVLVEGRAHLSGGGVEFGEIGERMSVFEKGSPGAVYVPDHTNWTARAVTDCTLAVCSAPGKGNRKARKLEIPPTVTRGTGSNTRHINNIAMEDQDVADSLLVTEVFTPAGTWSSYPPHRHDEDKFPEITYLEESYYHRLNPSQGYGHQRVFTDDGSIDETMSFYDHDVVLVPKGYHPCAAPHGYELYYLNVMAGPLRNWRFRNHPDHAWLAT